MIDKFTDAAMVGSAVVHWPSPSTMQETVAGLIGSAGTGLCDGRAAFAAGGGEVVDCQRIDRRSIAGDLKQWIGRRHGAGRGECHGEFFDRIVDAQRRRRADAAAYNICTGAAVRVSGVWRRLTCPLLSQTAFPSLGRQARLAESGSNTLAALTNLKWNPLVIPAVRVMVKVETGSARPVCGKRPVQTPQRTGSKRTPVRR